MNERMMRFACLTGKGMAEIRERPLSEIGDFDVLLEMKEDSLWTGMKIRNMMLPAELRPVIIRRGERTIEPSQNLIIRAGDILVLAAEGCEE